MKITKERNSQIVKEFGGTENNTGSAEVQVALITERINHISGHLQTHKKDHSTTRSLMKLVGQRKRLLNYLSKNDLQSYRKLIEKLDLRK